MSSLSLLALSLITNLSLGMVKGSFLPYDFAKSGQIETVVFTAANRETESFGQLYLAGSRMEVFCQLRYRTIQDTNETRRELVDRFALNGMRPRITFSNMTRNSSFEFNEFVVDENGAYWKVNISKSEISQDNFSLDSSEAWQYYAELGKGLNLFESSGTLVVKELEPLLNLQFGDEVHGPISVISPPYGAVIRHSACSPGVSAIVPLLDTSIKQFSGCFLGVTYSYFTPSSMKWYNLLHLSASEPDLFSICKKPLFSECATLSILDFAVLKNQMIVITSQGMLVSQIFTEALEMARGQKVTFSRVSQVYPPLDKDMELGILQKDQVNFHYTAHCHDLFISKHEEVLCLVYNSLQSPSNGSVLLCSSSPFTTWTDMTPRSYRDKHLKVLGVGHDIQRDRVTLLVRDITKGDMRVEIFDSDTQKVSGPPFHVDPEDNATRIYVHPFDSVLFVYGSQVWKSLDGGNSFHQVSDLDSDDWVTSFSCDFYGETYSFTTRLGTIYTGKTGIHRVRPIKSGDSGPRLKGIVGSIVVEQARSVLTLHFHADNGELILQHNNFEITDSTNLPITSFSSMMLRILSETTMEFFPLCYSALSKCGNLFDPTHVGQVIHSSYGGSAIIARLKKSVHGSRFEGSVIAEVIEPFQELQDDVTNHPLSVSFHGENATLKLADAEWRAEDKGRTIILPNGLSFIVLDEINSTTVIAVSHFHWTRGKGLQETYTGWTLYDFSSSKLANTSWWLEEDVCRSVLISSREGDAQFIHLDSRDNLSLVVSVISKVLSGEWPSVRALPKLLIGNSKLFVVDSSYSLGHLNNSLNLFIKQRPQATGSSSLTVFIEESSLLCRSSSFTIAVHSGCPPSKMLHFIYPFTASEDALLASTVKDTLGVVRNKKLPYNYRPPSARGVGIPMTANVYHADPARPQYRDAFVVTRSTYRYKQCKGKAKRSHCGCTRATKVSSLVQHSDCIEVVYRLLFDEKLTPRFLVLREGREAETLTSPYYLEELNNRSDFEIVNSSNKTVLQQAVVMEQAKNSSIYFYGSGLFHFRAFAVQENYTFCDLEAEFLVFVDETPLPYPAKDIIRACTAMGFFTLLYVLYLWNFHFRHNIINELEETHK
ncbi:predicted protein [Nematostella vectensis]|uniref:Cation channel sperm-associated protein subunit beta n=1 Tax=Nematostella vectensis TaxID=45351 RepID=A7RH07_NEMVE|nr:cation channel sperm-associated auxiliary subunit beta [Nematostella vectensis]EDO49139.1 predicted protein [Nematostella vectensis]|eukprot:XP_001641202.1 predicted protein [Nematostella vectensis]